MRQENIFFAFFYKFTQPKHKKFLENIRKSKHPVKSKAKHKKLENQVFGETAGEERKKKERDTINYT